MPGLLDLLYRDHDNMKKLFGVFEQELSIFNRGEPPDYDLIVEILDYCIAYPDIYHHPLEDLILERLKTRDPEAAAPIGDLHDEHNRLMAQTRIFLALVHDVRQQQEVPRAEFSEAAQSFLDAYRTHMRYEDETMFPAAAKSLTDEDWAEIEASWSSPYDPLFADRAEQRYRRLRNAVLEQYGVMEKSK
jgi:hemerythrin-like domain-containing protein